MSTRPLTSDLSTWRTPPRVFDPLHKEFGFVLDSCATPGHEMVPDYIPPEWDALTLAWHQAGGPVWCNPPYGRGVGTWMKKCAEEGSHVPVVVLVFVNTDTAWWHDFVMPFAAEVRLFRGRIAFLHPETGKAGMPAPRSSCVVVYRPGVVGPPVWRVV